jgi:flagellar basal-body rod protein FlgB
MVMNGNNSFKMLDIMQRSMGAASMRSDVINNNIANATTPNYKRQDVTFQSELERALYTEKAYYDIPFKTTNDRHIPIMRPKDYREVKAKKIVEYNYYQNNNGNSVDIDKEVMEGTKNSMYYNALAQRVAKEFNKIKYLLKS